VIESSNHDVFSESDEALGALHRKFGNGRVFSGVVERRATTSPSIVRCMSVTSSGRSSTSSAMMCASGWLIESCGDVLEERRLAGFGWRNDQARWPCRWAEKIDDARGELRGAHFESKRSCG